MKNIHILALLLIMPFAFAKDGDCIKTVAGYDPSFDKLEQSNRDRCLISDHLPENSCAYQNYKNNKKKPVPLDDGMISKLTSDLKPDPKDESTVKSALKTKLTNYSKSKCFSGKVKASWKTVNWPSEERIRNTNKNFKCDPKLEKEDPVNGTCTMQSLAVMYSDTDKKLIEEANKEIAAKKAECKKPGSPSNCFNAQKANEIYYKYGLDKAKKSRDRLVEDAMKKAEWRTNSFLGHPDKDDKYKDNVGADMTYCGNKADMQRRDTGRIEEPACPVTYISTFADNSPTPTLKAADPSQESACKAKEKDGYKPTAANVMTSSSSLDNTWPAQKDHCKKGFLSLSIERNAATVDALKSSGMIPPDVNPTKSCRGENGDGTSGECAYKITDASLQEKRDYTVTDKDLDKAKYARVIVTYTKPPTAQGTVGQDYVAENPCKRLTIECDTGLTTASAAAASRGAKKLTPQSDCFLPSPDDF